jgi:CYTH domain-containing protein
MGVEIEKKFTVKDIPFNLEDYPFHQIEQGYLNVHPAIRVRRQDDIYYMTYKGTPGEFIAERTANSDGQQDIGQTEYNMPLDRTSYDHLAAKADGNFIRKKRYLIPLNENAFDKEYLAANEDILKAVENGDIMIELDIFEKPFEGRILAEVEFPSEDAARNYHPAEWFYEDVTGDRRYSNSQMSLEVLNKNKY